MTEIVRSNLNCRCDQNDDTEDSMNLSALKRDVFPLVFYTFFVSANTNLKAVTDLHNKILDASAPHRFNVLHFYAVFGK